MQILPENKERVFKGGRPVGQTLKFMLSKQNLFGGVYTTKALALGPNMGVAVDLHEDSVLFTPGPISPDRFAVKSPNGFRYSFFGDTDLCKKLCIGFGIQLKGAAVPLYLRHIGGGVWEGRANPWE
jgi:hypothetical protein